MADEGTKLDIDKTRLVALGKTLKSRYSEYEKARASLEQQWIKNSRQYKGEYDPSVLEGLNTDQSRAYPKITRVKVRSLVARLHAMLFPAGEKNWGVESSPRPKLPLDQLTKLVEQWQMENPEGTTTQEDMDLLVKKFALETADRMESVIDDQLCDTSDETSVDYSMNARSVIYSSVLQGCGVLKGPMTVADAGGVVRVENGVPSVIDVETYRPYFEWVSLWDYYPDLSAKTFKGMEGQFQRHVYTRSQVSALAERDDYMGDEITQYLTDHTEGNYRKRDYETQLDTMAAEKSQTQPAENRKLELMEYWGDVLGADLRACGQEVKDSDLSKTLTACIWIIDDVVVKAAVSPFGRQFSMYHQFVFEEDEISLTGSGLPLIMRDSQMGVSTFTRMLVDNAASVCGPNVEVDVEQLSSNDTDLVIRPFKVWRKDNASPTGGNAVIPVKFDAHMNELQSAIQMFRELADTETFVNPMTGGDMENMPSEALRTQGNMSMAMGSAALPFKDVVRNFDKFTSSVISSLVQWNLEYHEDRDQLQGDLRPVAKGASSLMAKEIRAFTLDNLSATLTPEDRVYINEEELLKERLASRDLPLAKLLAAPDEVKRRKEANAQQAQKQTEQNDAMFQAELKTLMTEALKDTVQAQKNLGAMDADIAKVFLDAVEQGVDIDALKQAVTMAAGQRAAAPGNGAGSGTGESPDVGAA